jgi:hypothetical protein
MQTIMLLKKTFPEVEEQAKLIHSDTSQNDVWAEIVSWLLQRTVMNYS